MGEEAKAGIISEILKLEWPMFQAVNNEGGKAACQDNQEAFVIVRGTYYLVWDISSLESLLKDFQAAGKAARNMVMEKYARMMEDSDPDYFHTKLKPYLPVIDSEINGAARRITEQYLTWEKEFMLKYPALAKRSRQLTNGTNALGTGEKEYLMGELQTYSHETLKKYAAHVQRMRDCGINLVFQIKEMTVSHGGYQSLDDAERKIGGNEP
jgi:hypothetical protein